MAKKMITVCDVCESADSVSVWEVRSLTQGRKKRSDLCTRCAAPLARLLSGLEQQDGEHQSPETAPTPRRRGRAQVVSVAEIEAQKAAQGS